MSTAERCSSIPDSTPQPSSTARCRTRTRNIATENTALGGTSTGQSRPNPPGAALAYCFDLVRRGQAERALPLLDALLAQDSKNHDLLFLRGKARLMSGESLLARADLALALTRSPNHVELQVWHALSLLDASHYSILQRELARLLERAA
jgi:Flp pilus assembly protein TadD